MIDPPFELHKDASSLQLSWKSSAVDAQYELEMSIDNGVSWTSLSNKIKATNIRKNNLRLGVGYIFRLRYCTADVWSHFSRPSEPFYVLDPKAIVLEPPEMHSRDEVSITVQWKAVDGVNAYKVRFRDEESPWNEISTLIHNTIVRKKGLSKGRKYYFSVCPMLESDGISAFSPPSLPLTVAYLSTYMEGLLPTSILSKKGSEVTSVPSSTCSNKIIAIYFSAHWCPPCRQFTPKLAALYKEILAANLPVEIIFCSADHNKDDFHHYYNEMPWSAVPYDDTKREQFMGIFKVSGIPRLTVLGASGRIIVDNAVSGGNLTLANVNEWIRLSSQYS